MYLAFFERKSRPCGKPCPRTLPLSNGSVFILGYGGDSKRGLVRGLEWFVCSIYGHPRILSVNEARKKAFWNKFNKEKKIIDLSVMPPCQSNLHYHIMRAKYVAYIF